MKAVIIPELCKGENAKYSGSVEMRPPFIEERWEYLEECGMLKDAAPKSQEDMDKVDTMDLGRTVVKTLLPKLNKHILKVDLLEIATGEKIESLDELRMDPEAGPLLIELGAMLLKGFKPSKN